MPANRLIREKSPYLQQHAHNPVDWYPWGEEAFAKARAEDKPIFLSVGYSTCHWCHVMERESFESEEVAAILNRHFVPVKVDREERPDVDRMYMLFVQATTGGGGWPMSVWLAPDLKPFFGGTYFPPDDRYGRPGFGAILEQIAGAWLVDRAKIVQAGADILEQLRRHSEVRALSGSWLDDAVLDSGFQIFRRMFDARMGGFGQAPKFPRPVVHNFLLRYWKKTGNTEARDMVLATLRDMAKGGMFDQLGGGFHRYSVDDRWFVPHFEKMLYDQAQLAVSYLEAFQITGEPWYADVARSVLDYVLRDLTDPEGGFYSAEDADSVIDPAHPHEKGEGAFYIWSLEELRQLLPEPAASWFAYRFGAEEAGNVRQDPHGEFAGKSILFQARTVEETAAYFGVGKPELEGALAQACRRLMEARAHRVRPHRDDKILTAWNGLMLSAFALGAQVLAEPRYEEAARRAADFVLGRLYEPAGAGLRRRYRGGEAAIPAFLDDYAFLILGLTDLYETCFDPHYLDTAVTLAETMQRLFEDKEAGGFYATAPDDASILLRMKDDYDGAEPSGNSAAILALLRLGEMTGRAAYRDAAAKALGAFAPRLRSAPVGLPQMLVAYLYSQSKPRQIILAGSRRQAQPFLESLHRRFLPERFVMLADSDQTRRRLSAYLPAIAAMTAADDRATAYVCRDYACQSPTSDVEKFEELLQ